MKSKLGTNVQQLRRIYEPCIVGRNPSVNNLNHTTIAAIYHAMFTLTVRKIRKCEIKIRYSKYKTIDRSVYVYELHLPGHRYSV